MELKQTIFIMLISIILLSVTAIAAPASDNTNTDTPGYNTDTPGYSTSMSDTTTMKSNPEEVAPDLVAAFTATHDPNNPLTIRFTETSIGQPVSYIWGTKYGQMTYFWGFGDKTTSILRNPVHSFKEPGLYKVYLRIQNAEGQVSKAVMYINVK